MLSADDNEILVRTNVGTPMGDYFRRYWLPVALSREMPAPDSPPIRVKVMGEELVAFRDTNGRVGLIEPSCAHRGTSLFFGRNEECGLRCIHHGWKYDVDGKCVDMPNVEADAGMHGKVSIKAYPTREFGDMVWAYLGPREVMPELPQLEHGMLPAAHCYVTKRLQQCNWAQSMDGALDTAHFSFLHMPAPKIIDNSTAGIAADENRIRWLRSDPMPQFTILDHDVGFVVGGARKADGRDFYWRITQFMLPTHSITPSAMPGEIYYGYTWVPVDDESCWIYVYGWHPEREISAAERAKFDKGGYGQFAELGPGYLPLRNRTNDYLIDREEQKKISFTGIRGIAEQDTMAQESQGLIADRTKEHLTATDVAVVRFRRLMLREAKALRDGKEPVAATRPASYRLRSGGAVLPSDLSFEDVMKKRFGSPSGEGFVIRLLAFTFIFILSNPVKAQEYPVRPVTVIVPFSAGSASDVIARIVLERMGTSMGRRFIVDNRPAAGGTVGTVVAMKAEPDGYTLVMGASGPLVVNKALNPKLEYDPEKDFDPIGLYASMPNVVTVSAKLPINSLAELTDYLRKNPNAPYSSVGNGSSQHLAGVFFEQLTGVKMQHVPYRITSQLQADMISGQVPLSFQLLPNVIGAIKSGQARPLAVASNRRLPALPDTPTAAEAGLKGYDSAAWFGFVAPHGTPRGPINLLNKEISAATADPAVRAKLTDFGAEPLASTPEEFGKFISTEMVKWRGIITRGNITLE